MMLLGHLFRLRRRLRQHTYEGRNLRTRNSDHYLTQHASALGDNGIFTSAAIASMGGSFYDARSIVNLAEFMTPEDPGIVDSAKVEEYVKSLRFSLSELENFITALPITVIGPRIRNVFPMFVLMHVIMHRSCRDTNQAIKIGCMEDIFRQSLKMTNLISENATLDENMTHSISEMKRQGLGNLVMRELGLDNS
jgi:hypothetical protein